eukprot:CAMPEP_0185175046 /NCGR_PEP_ID=MMETSP1139-20130426/26158_1 /TAXON_ID=298111 /ORGANISM="Pavlova sp., Strain CCMP459" /LENGTH=58 /DNA_ID=CAMNT_0027740777 /DNA_START=20 /DNA_END=193 /DNA_ORIENTATION=-
MVRASSLSARARASEQTQLVPPSAAGHLMFTPRLTQAMVDVAPPPRRAAGALLCDAHA